MKKYFYPVIAATTLLMAASCSQDEELIAGKDGDMVTFTINTGEVETRLAGDGTTVNTVHYEVWDKNTGKLVISTIPSSGAMTTARTAPVEGKHATVSMSLVKGVPYDITFWAQREEASAYDISAGLDDIKLKSGLVCNNEYYDAFFKTIEDFKVKTGSTTVELKRPFAQVNIGTTPADWQRAIDLGVEIDKSTVTVSGIHDQFNARTADATGSTTVTYALNSLINEQFKVKTVNGENEYQYLAMNYMLADPDKTLHDLNVTFKDGEQEINSLSVTNMPIQRNWRTNIVGRVLTSDEDFEIIIVPEFDGDHNIDIWGGDVKELQEIDGKYTVTEASHLAWIAQQVNKGETFNGKTVVLASDIDLNNHVWTPIGLDSDKNNVFRGTFDGQGHTICNLFVEREPAYESAGLFGSVAGTLKNFVIENATVKHIVTSGNGNSSNGVGVVAGALYDESSFKGVIDGVTVKNAEVRANRYAAGIAGYCYGNVTNCTVEDISVVVTPNSYNGAYDNGDKAGALIGYCGNGQSVVSGNTVKDAEIYGYRDLGGIAGAAYGTISNNTVDGVSITIDQLTNSYGTKASNAAGIVGREMSGVVLSGNNESDVTISYAVFNADNLVEALEQGQDVLLFNDVKISPAGMSNAYGTTGINVKNGQTIDGGGHTLDIKGAGGTWDSGINTTGGLIKNLTVTGSFRGIFINHNSTHSETVVLENVIIDGTTYTISCDQGLGQGLEATGCTFNGWTSYAATLGTVKFTDCNFGEGNGYAYCRPYAPTEFVGCEFEAGFEMDARAKVTFENCTLDGVAITADNIGTLVTSNTANATVK